MMDDGQCICACRYALYQRLMAVAREANMMHPPGADTVCSHAHTHSKLRKHAHARTNTLMAHKCLHPQTYTHTCCTEEEQEQEQEQGKRRLLSTCMHATHPPTRWADTDPLSTSQIEKLLAAEALGSPDMAALQARLGFPIRRPEVLGSRSPVFPSPARSLPPGGWHELNAMEPDARAASLC